jgi:predicted transcriptional regulator
MAQHETHLSRRERQIMDIVYARGEASATDVLNDLSDPPTRTAVRTLMRILEEKGHLVHHKKGREFIYQPVRPRMRAGLSALQNVVRTFFDGSLEKAVALHLSDPGAKLSDDELKSLAELIREARKKGT